MEEKTCHPDAADNDSSGILRSTRSLPPAHYLFQIKNFSLFLGMKEEKINSREFEVGGYRWILVLYPNGKKISNEYGHISLYLAIADTSDLPVGWEVHTNIKFFVFDQIRDTYLTIQDGRVSRYHNFKTEWGFAQLLSHDTLNDPSNGYLFDDTCLSGVEVFVIKSSSKGECLSLMKQPENNYYTWRINNYETLKESNYSEPFTIGGRRWRLQLDRKQGGTLVDKYFSLYLNLDDLENLPASRKFYAEYKLRIRNQSYDRHIERTASFWFPQHGGYGFPKFATQSDLASLYCLMNNTMVIECKIDVISVVEDLFKTNQVEETLS